METEDSIITKITLAPILRLTAISFQKQYYQSKREDSEIMHYLGEEVQSGIKDYFELMEAPARSSGDSVNDSTKRYCSILGLSTPPSPVDSPLKPEILGVCSN